MKLKGIYPSQQYIHKGKQNMPLTGGGNWRQFENRPMDIILAIYLEVETQDISIWLKLSWLTFLWQINFFVKFWNLSGTRKFGFDLIYPPDGSSVFIDINLRLIYTVTCLLWSDNDLRTPCTSLTFNFLLPTLYFHTGCSLNIVFFP